MGGGEITPSFSDMILACLQRLASVQLGHTFEPRIGSCLLGLQGMAIRLQRLAIAAGVSDQQSQDPLSQLETDDIGKVNDAVERIELQLSRAQEEFCKNDLDPQKRAIVNRSEQMEMNEPGVTEAYSARERVRSQYQESLWMITEFSGCSTWALYQRKQYQAVFLTTEKPFAILESIFQKQVDKLAKKEADDLGQEAIKILAWLHIVQDTDPIFASALQAKVRNDRSAPLQTSWSDIHVGGNARVHFGHIFN